MSSKAKAASAAPAQKTPLAARIFLGACALYLLVPFLTTLVYSLFVEWTDVLPSGFTLRNYAELFTNSTFWLSIGRTLVLCLVSVAITIVLLLLAMYVVVAVNRRLGRFMQFVCMIPYALQGVILSIGIISLYTGTVTILSNRMFMLFGAYTILVLPYIYQGIRNALNAIDANMLIQAAEMLGCGRFRAAFAPTCRWSCPTSSRASSCRACWPKASSSATSCSPTTSRAPTTRTSRCSFRPTWHARAASPAPSWSSSSSLSPRSPQSSSSSSEAHRTGKE